jgi:hypothetical protein
MNPRRTEKDGAITMTLPRTLAEFISDQLALGRSVRFELAPLTSAVRLAVTGSSGETCWSGEFADRFVAALPETIEMAAGNVSAALALAERS